MMNPTPDQVAKRPVPKADSEAPECEEHGCNVRFGLMKRRHHCRGCGFIYCDKHCKNMAEIPLLGYYTPVRICDGCLINGVEDPEDAMPPPVHGKTDKKEKKEKKDKKEKKEKKSKEEKKEKEEKKGKKKKGKREAEEEEAAAASEAASSPMSSPHAGSGPPAIPPRPGQGPPPVPGGPLPNSGQGPPPVPTGPPPVPGSQPGASADIAGLVDRIAHLEKMLEQQRTGPSPAKPGEEGLSTVYPAVVFKDSDGDRIAVGIAADHSALLYTVNHEPRPPFLVAKYHADGPAIEFADIDTAVVLPKGTDDAVVRQMVKLVDFAVHDLSIDVLHNFTSKHRAGASHSPSHAAAAPPAAAPASSAALPGVDQLRYTIPLPQSSPFHDPMARQRAAEAERWDSDDDFSSSDDDWGPNKVVMTQRAVRPPPPGAVPAPPTALLALPAPPAPHPQPGLHCPPPPVPHPGEAVLAIAPPPGPPATASLPIAPVCELVPDEQSAPVKAAAETADVTNASIASVPNASMAERPGVPNMMALAAAAGTTRLRKTAPTAGVRDRPDESSIAELRKNLKKADVKEDAEGAESAAAGEHALADLRKGLKKTEAVAPEKKAPEEEPVPGQHLLRKTNSIYKTPTQEPLPTPPALPAASEPLDHVQQEVTAAQPPADTADTADTAELEKEDPAAAPPAPAPPAPAPPAPAPPAPAPPAPAPPAPAPPAPAPPAPAPSAAAPPAPAPPAAAPSAPAPVAPAAVAPAPSVPAPSAPAPSAPVPASAPAAPEPSPAAPEPAASSVPPKPPAPPQTKGMFDDSSDDDKPRAAKPAAKKNLAAMLKKKRRPGDSDDDDW